jgi:hypothetical protein
MKARWAEVVDTQNQHNGLLCIGASNYTRLPIVVCNCEIIENDFDTVAFSSVFVLRSSRRDFSPDSSRCDKCQYCRYEIGRLIDKQSWHEKLKRVLCCFGGADGLASARHSARWRHALASAYGDNSSSASLYRITSKCGLFSGALMSGVP